MATGRLGTPGDFTSIGASNYTLYTCPSSTFAVVTVSLCNRNASTNRNIRIALSASTSPTDAEWLEYDAELVSKGVLERTGIVVGAGQNIVVYASGAGISAVCYGIETPTA